MLGRKAKGYMGLSPFVSAKWAAAYRGTLSTRQMLVRGLQPPPSPPVLYYKGGVPTLQHLFVPIMSKTPPQSNTALPG